MREMRCKCVTGWEAFEPAPSRAECVDLLMSDCKSPLLIGVTFGALPSKLSAVLLVLQVHPAVRI
jgi:hypothetical protein